jgi:hypothetical protein
MRITPTRGGSATLISIRTVVSLVQYGTVRTWATVTVTVPHAGDCSCYPGRQGCSRVSTALTRRWSSSSGGTPTPGQRPDVGAWCSPHHRLESNPR